MSNRPTPFSGAEAASATPPLLAKPLTKVALKRLEQIAILRCLINYGPQTSAEIRQRVNTECDHDALENLPEIGSRAAGSKLSGLWWQGYVTGEPMGRRPTVFAITGPGRALVAGWEQTQERKGSTHA